MHLRSGPTFTETALHIQAKSQRFKQPIKSSTLMALFAQTQTIPSKSSTASLRGHSSEPPAAEGGGVSHVVRMCCRDAEPRGLRQLPS